jgi:hypothetical protein
MSGSKKSLLIILVIKIWVMIMILFSPYELINFNDEN